MLPVPTRQADLTRFANDLIETCMGSAGTRSAQCRLLHTIIETGRQDAQQTKSKLNLLYNHLDRLTAYLYSPTDLRFILDFENEYPKDIYDKAAVVARVLTRDWERNGIDVEFGSGVFESLKYGSAILKQWTEPTAFDETDPNLCKRLVSMWNFGVYMEDENDLNKQPALCERMWLSMPEVWQRIRLLPNAKELFKRIKAHARQGESDWNTTYSGHWVLSTSQINTTGIGQSGRVPSGGIVDLANSTQATMSPEITIDRVLMHELWVQDDKDYTTIQIIDPDIVITPYAIGQIVMKKSNLLIPGDIHSCLHPYSLIQPNRTQGYIWGRPEIADLIMPQMMLSTAADDMERLIGVQIDKVLAFSGVDGLTDERYDQMRGAGWAAAPQGGQIQDITPKVPAELLPWMKDIKAAINEIGGMSDLMQGRGDTGVRAGSHANTLLKTGSPRLRDRSLLVERQCAMAADLTLAIKTAKDGDRYWTKGDTVADMDKSSFRLTDLPDDRRVAVDSHSSSPIFQDDHQNLIGFGVKAGFIDGEEAIDDLPFPNKERKKQRFREKQARQAQQLEQLKQQDPEAYAKALSKGGGRR